ncbi:3-octaprenyl-4-hydroxybenzoate carboxy-lyase [Serratia fonticola]|uniref:3-octaprenyl-4-hydroxybenzoate carboxy-lyase n=1 Tax=Serratia fonticola TaxID=47917 RepID=A0A4U9V826_SERFO|nr:3-octaprenyl-4-hydroxybenzoate carboxy-lyase [Serratia fonticola]
MLLSAAPPAWHDEYNYASAFLGHGIEMVKAETCDVLVPAECEIIIEGYVSADKSVAEGPFGEFPGYLPTSPA